MEVYLNFSNFKETGLRLIQGMYQNLEGIIEMPDLERTEEAREIFQNRPTDKRVIKPSISLHLGLKTEDSFDYEIKDYLVIDGKALEVAYDCVTIKSDITEFCKKRRSLSPAISGN